MTTKPPDVNEERKAGAFNPEDTEPMRDPDEPAPKYERAKPRRYSLDDLEEDERRELLSLADLPLEHGWGHQLDKLTGYGLAPGDVVALGAAGAGAGKTSLLMQLADGLALRSAELVESGRPGPLTPTLILSEMAPRTLAHRTLGRLVDAPAWYFRSGKVAGLHRPDVREAYGKARAALATSPAAGAFQRLAEWQRTARPARERGQGVLSIMRAEVEAFREEVAALHPTREVWPLVVVDPIQRWQDGALSEVEALNELAEGVDQLADENGWIVLLTSDTNKSAAVGKEDKDSAGAAMFRGSYKLFHSCDLVLSMEAEPYDSSKPSRSVKIGIEKSRNSGPGGAGYLEWNGATGRFRPGEAPPPKPAKEAKAKRPAQVPFNETGADNDNGA